MEAFIFDMDGVIVDTQSVHTEALAETFAHYGVSVNCGELAAYAGTKRGASFRDISENRGLDLPVDEMSDFKDRIFDDKIARMTLAPIDGIPELLKKLRDENIPAAIASSSPDAFISLVVDRLGIREYFHALVSGQKLPRSKPDPAIYLLAAKTLGVDPAHCVALEDAHLGVAAAKAAGMYTIGYQNPNSGAQDLSAADRVVSHISEIISDWNKLTVKT